MSALPPEADMPIVGINVCLVPTADVRSGSVPTRTNFSEGSEVGITRHPRSSYEGAGAGVAARLGSVGFELFLASFSRRRLLLACSRRLSYAPSLRIGIHWGVSWISSLYS